MMKMLLAATAIAALAVTAYAADDPTVQNQTQSQAQPSPMTPDSFAFLVNTSSGAHLASQLIGETVYDSDTPDAQAIGEINDLIVADDGRIEAVVIGVGGFLGAGEKNVGVDFHQLTWVAVSDGSQPSARLMLATTAEQLQSAPEFDVSVLQTDPAARMLGPETETTATAPVDPAADGYGVTEPADDTAMAPEPAPAQDPMAAPLDQQDDQVAGIPDGSFTDVDATTISANDLINTSVYSAENENVGSVGDVILSDDGTIDAVVLDIGGFLGLGQKPVAIAFDALTIRRDENDNLFVFTGFTREQLEGAPDYDQDRYLDERDTMRLRAST